MKKSNKYLLLAALFFVGYLVIEFTDIYSDSTWFKFFLILICVTFLISGVSQKRKEWIKESTK